jgi:hypothetical protein
MTDRLEQIAERCEMACSRGDGEYGADVGWLLSELEQARARIAELEAALAGDAGNVIYFAEQQGAVATIRHIIAGLEQMLQQMARDQVGIEANQETNTRSSA